MTARNVAQNDIGTDVVVAAGLMEIGRDSTTLTACHSCVSRIQLRWRAKVAQGSIDRAAALVLILLASPLLLGRRPRPPVPSEVAATSALLSVGCWSSLVSPGCGISGRSNLSWEQTVRLALRYAETWTLALGAQILLKTVRAALRGNGAY
jgi:hypothetical protein